MRSRVSFILPALIAVLPVAIATAQTAAPTPAARLERAARVQHRLASERATFTQTLTNPLTGSDVTSRGVLEERRPDRFAVHFTQPAGDAIIADGRWIWIYTPSTTPGQVIRSRAAASSTGIPGLLQLLDSAASRFIIADSGAALIGGHATHAVRLTTRPGASAPFAHAVVWIDDGDALIRKLALEDESGQQRLVTFDHISPDANVNASRFIFRVPPGVKVFDRRGD